MKNITIWNDRVLNSWSSIVDLHRTLDRLLDLSDGDTRNEVWSEQPVFQPACDFQETDSHYLLSLDLPGVSKKDMNIEVKNDQLFISGERKYDLKTLKTSERFHGKFYRVFNLPKGIKIDKIEAEYQDGVLSLAVPKPETARPKQIQISEGKGSLWNKLLGVNKETKNQEREVASVDVA